MKKYELLLDDTKTMLGVTLYRVRYIRDFADIKSGDLGGYIEKEENLSHDGDARVLGDAHVFGNARVLGNAHVFGNAWVCGDARVSGDAHVFGNAWVYDNASVSGNASMCGDARVSDDAWVYGNSVCKVLSPLNIIGLRWNITLTDNNIHIGCKTFTLEKALKLALRWKETMLEYDEAKTIAHEKKLIVEAIKLRLNQIKGKEETR